MRDFLRALTLCALLGSGCQYDVGRLYTRADAGSDDAGSSPKDAAAEDGETLPIPPDLIDLFAGWEGIDDECRACARENCASENKACRDDPECAQLTACLASKTDPNGHMACRAKFKDYLERAKKADPVGGAYYDCMLWHRCQDKCSKNARLNCVGNFRWQLSRDDFTVRLRFLTSLANSVIPDATVRACGLEATNCEPAEDVNTTDARGVAQLALRGTERGPSRYFIVESPEIRSTIWLFDWSFTGDSFQYAQVLSKVEFNLASMIEGIEVLPGGTNVQVDINDCANIPMAFVRFEVSTADENTKQWYYDGNVNINLTETTFFGHGGFVNVPPGPFTLRAFGRDGKLVAQARSLARADTTTFIRLAPLDVNGQ